MKKKLLIAILALVFTAGFTAQLFAAGENKPVEMSADTIEYDSVQGIMKAQGGVRVTQENSVMTGDAAVYNTKTQEATITGGVKVVRDKTTLTAPTVVSRSNDHLIATGGAVLVSDDKTLQGEQIEYLADKQYAVVPGKATIVSRDATMTADHLEAFIGEDKVIANGNVHIVSAEKKLDATSDLATYYGAKAAQNQGRVILTGNARAVQEGNVLTGNTLTIYLDDKAMNAQGRTKLVVIPQQTQSK